MPSTLIEIDPQLILAAEKIGGCRDAASANLRSSIANGSIDPSARAKGALAELVVGVHVLGMSLDEALADVPLEHSDHAFTVAERIIETRYLDKLSHQCVFYRPNEVHLADVWVFVANANPPAGSDVHWSRGVKFEVGVASASALVQQLKPRVQNGVTTSALAVSRDALCEIHRLQARLIAGLRRSRP